HILRNDKGVFADVANSVAPAFAYCGMVRDIAFADLNGDKRAEMIVAGEWMPLTIFQNTGGRYEDATTQFGLDKTQGFWRSLGVADLDGDGDMDLLAGNLGLNSRLTASEASPLFMYAKDFDSNGSVDPLMGYTKDGVEYPLALREVLLKQLPVLKKKFVRNKPYAYAKMEDLYPESELKSAKYFKANVLQSAYFENQNGKFVLKPLPNLAQISPVNAFLIRDLNADGKPDIVLAGNDYGQQIETSPIDSGNGLVLLNEGGGNFKPLTGCVSGLWAKKDARSLKLLNTAQGKTLLLVGNNNDKMQVFDVKAGKVMQ
ncbi:MAG: VCBS repeat-containing protein, partial [Saprospiraceae bacterium]|nr:VCBS repeat-containing protein [Saprospiraceae bacterium]